METTSYTENYLRLKLLEVKAGTPVLRELLLSIIHSLSVRDIDEFLSNFKNEIEKVKHSVSAKYIKILFKTGGTEVKTWDISLLAYVLIHCCTLEGQLTLKLESNPKNILNKEVKHVNGGNIDQFLNLNKGSIDQLKEDNEITEEQYQLLFPLHSGKTDINTWDIELLIRVLFKLCSRDTVETIRNACKTVLTREVRLCSKTVELRVFLAKHQSTFDKLKQEGKLTHSQSEQLFPTNPGVPPDINNFDDDVLIIVVLNACQPFSQKTRESIESIRQIRNNQAHPGDSEINHDDFRTKWKILYNSIFNIVDNELPQMKEAVTDAVHDFAIGSLDIRSSLVVLKDFYTNESDTHMLEQLCQIKSKLLSMETRIGENTKALNEGFKHQDAQYKELMAVVKNIQQRCPEPKFSKHRDIACFSVVFEVEGTSEEIVDAVEDFVKKAMKSDAVDENGKILKILSQILKTFSKHDTRIVNIKEGSIILELQCVSIKGLLFTINTVNSMWLKQEINDLAALFSKLHKSPIQISAFIPNSSLETIIDDIKRIDLECSPKKHQRFVEMELKASSVKGLVHAWETLQGTELSSKLQTVSSILSSQHGEQVDIKVHLQPDTFQAALTSAGEYGLPDEILDRTPTDKEIASIAKKIGKEYQHLFLLLGFSEAEIEQSRIENPRYMVDRTRNMLMQWKYKFESATFRELATAMRSVHIDTFDVFKDII